MSHLQRVQEQRPRLDSFTLTKTPNVLELFYICHIMSVVMSLEAKIFAELTGR